MSVSARSRCLPLCARRAALLRIARSPLARLSDLCVGKISRFTTRSIRCSRFDACAVVVADAVHRDGHTHLATVEQSLRLPY